MDKLFEDSYNRVQAPVHRRFIESHLTPRADAWENEEQVTIEMALPGVNLEDVEITFEQDTLTIQGTFPTLDDSKNWIVLEIRRGTFQRRFTLQVAIDVDKVAATSRNGLLVLTLPKSEASKPRKITINAARE
jgi:HSP20 family protein